MRLPSLASVVLCEKKKRRKKETMPFHVCTDFKHARSYAPNTLPSSVTWEVRVITEMERIQERIFEAANRRLLSAAPPDWIKVENRVPSV